MPLPIAKIHDKLVNNLTSANTNNVIHKQRQLFLLNKRNFLVLVDLFADYYEIYKEDLSMIFFMKPIIEIKGTLIVTSDFKVEGINR